VQGQRFGANDGGGDGGDGSSHAGSSDDQKQGGRTLAVLEIEVEAGRVEMLRVESDV